MFSPGCVLVPIRKTRCHYPASLLRTVRPSGLLHPQGEVELELKDIFTLCVTLKSVSKRRAAGAVSSPSLKGRGSSNVHSDANPISPPRILSKQKK